MKKAVIILLLGYSSLIYAQEFTDLYGDYLGQPLPGDIPLVFARGLVSTDLLEHSPPAFSPDGNEVFWWLNRPPNSENEWWDAWGMTMRRIDGRWTVPEVSRLFVGEPVFSTDGKRIYFGSYNKTDGPWFVEKQGNSWSEAKNIGLISRFPELQFAYMPSIARNGTLYFIGHASGPLNDTGIYRAELVNGEYTQPQLLPPSIINLSGILTWTPFIAPDESYLIFSSERSGQLGLGDLYISFHDVTADTWTEPVNMGEPINTDTQERLPGVSPDGRYLFFTRYNPPYNQDVFWVDAQQYLPDPNGSVLNLSIGIRFATIQAAIRLAQPGDEIVIEPGVYQENLTIDGKDIILRSADPNDPFYIGGTIIQGDPNEPVVTLSNNTASCTLAGLSLRAGSIGISGAATDATIRNCRMMDNRQHGLELFQESSPYLKHCLIMANGQTGITMHDEQGGRAPSQCQPTIEDCVIVQNGDAALEGGEPVIIESIIQD
jgi:hypothetical protein